MRLTTIYSNSAGSSTDKCVEGGTCKVSHKTWGQYSPYFSAPEGSLDPGVPKKCEITHVSMLSRHGSRFPTQSKSLAYKELIEQIQGSVTNYAKGYEFMKSYRYDLGADDLTPYGQKEMERSGKAFYKRYKKLVKLVTEPFIRASGSDRVIMSAQNFTMGFYNKQGRNASEYLPYVLVLPEGEDFNNTLDHGNCAAFEDGPASNLGNDKKEAWRKIWVTPITERLNKKLPGANLTLEETVFIMDLCPFNTVASSKAKHSKFCRLFSQDEWHGYDYYESLEKWYGYGPGNPLGPSQGVGYVNELIARLTNSPVEDHTSTNSTLDHSAPTFPLNRKLFADFSHDNTMTSVYGALGLYEMSPGLPVDHKVPPTKAEGYSAAWTVPFGARMYVEKMVCDGNQDYELVRILVNDRVVPIPGCDVDKYGRCKLPDFLAGLSFAKGGGHWDQCQVS